MKETITLQLGNYSNHVGSHYWNEHMLAYLRTLDSFTESTDEIYNNSQLFRTKREDSIQPRVLIADLKANVGRMINENDEDEDTYNDGKYNGADRAIDWDGSLSQVHRSDAPERNPFQMFLKNCGSETYDGESAYLRLNSQFTPSPPLTKSDKRPSESCIHYWTDYSCVPFDDSVNMCLMPRWTTRENFDTFLSSYCAEVVPHDYIDEFMEKLRYLAEECDSMSTIQVFADLHDGFSAITCKLVQQIREDYGFGVNLPVWTFAAGRDYTSSQGLVNDSDLSNALHSLSAPHAYAAICEHASLVVPVSPAAAADDKFSPFISTRSDSYYQSSAVIASAIEAAIGFQHYEGNRGETSQGESMDEWLYKATSAGRFPICELEAALPFPLAPDASTAEFSNAFDGATAELIERRSGREQMPMLGTRPTERSAPLNPFASSLSSAVWGPLSVPASEYIRDRYRPFTNMLSIRGPCPQNLPQILFSKCNSPNYLVTACVRRQTSLNVPASYPHYFHHVDENGHAYNPKGLFPFDDAHTHRMNEQDGHGHQNEGSSCTRFSAIAAIGCDQRTGMHLARAASSWSLSIQRGRVRAQVEKVGMDRDEFGEVAEKILALSRAYDSSVEL